MQIIMCTRPDQEAERRETVKVLVALARGFEQRSRLPYGTHEQRADLEIALEYQMDAVILANA